MKPPRILIISLGNPYPYTNTLHSAGHHALAALQPLLPAQPIFSAKRIGSKSCASSLGPDYALLQSPAIMNVSGRWVSHAYREMLAGRDPREMGLLLVHDDLEEDLGVVRTRKWQSSHRGHNGIKSVNKALKPADDLAARPPWARISVGIGRPEGRLRETVSDFVLRQMGGEEVATLRERAGPGVLRCLEEWEAKTFGPKPES